MNYYWKVRLYRSDGNYWICQIKTGRNLQEINVIQDFYLSLTGAKMLLEGMAEEPYNCGTPNQAFNGMLRDKGLFDP